MKIQATCNYEEIDDAYNDGKKGIVLPGGTRSSKTVSALQWLIIYCMQNTGKEIAICRDSLTNLRRTVLKDFEGICRGYNNYDALYPKMHMNKSEFTCKINGNNITFFGLNDDPMRVYGFACDIFFINEAINVPKNVFDQLEQRCREFWILDCNPSEPNSWVYLLNLRDDVIEFRSTYLDNPFLPKTIIKKIESYEPTKHNDEQGTSDPRKWCIYGKGEVYKGKEIIYPTWGLYKENPKEYDYIFYGLDWGYNDPLACIKVIIKGNDLYVREIIYGSNIDSMEDIVEMLLNEEEIKNQKTYVVCDTNEPRSIITLNKSGVPAMKANKKGGIIEGIRKVNQYKIHVHEDSKNIIMEFNNYKYKIDEKTDTILDIAVDNHNHACDAIRYPIVTFL
jgi:phage terminase large subunit